MVKAAKGELHGILVQGSLRDQSILGSMRVLGRKVSGSWTLLRVGVDPEGFEETVRAVQRNLVVEKGVPYYAHFYRDDELVVVFPERLFHVRPDRSTWGQVVEYGKAVGIPEVELDFKPCRFEEETY